MNYFFFLDHPDKSLEPIIELYNRAPMDLYFSERKTSKFIYLFYIKNQTWHNELYGSIDYNKSIKIRKSDLRKELRDKSVFISITSQNLEPEQPPFNDNSMKSIPAWRSNIKISSEYTSTSYQGEIPGSFLNLNLSLTSCSPFLQFEENIENFFYLINFHNNPIRQKFELEILDTKKKLLHKTYFETNKVNIINLKFLENAKHSNDYMYVFRSKDYGGIPLYFSRTTNNKSFSLEHTHPPQEYLFLGNRNFYQKKKKSYWLDD